ncbi:hypothetical protein HKX42_00060 [Salinisphaera sp. USBA-960]|nr:hypothetical protein [Salifodinibacter halophilus]NNC25285.1 hypothetical protein [Salifodinibacter halophilus]
MANHKITVIGLAMALAGIVVVAPQGAHAKAGDSATRYFESTYKALQDTGDYPPEHKQLAHLKNGGVRVSPLVYKGDMREVIDDSTARAAVNAIYMTFAQTHRDTVHVVAFPMQTDSQLTHYKELDAPHYDLTVTRTEAANVANRLTGMHSFEELIKKKYGLYLWSDTAEKMLYSAQGPGPIRVLRALGS